MVKLEVLISTEDGTVLQAFDVMESNGVGEVGDIELAHEVKEVLSARYCIEDK